MFANVESHLGSLSEHGDDFYACISRKQGMQLLRFGGIVSYTDLCPVIRKIPYANPIMRSPWFDKGTNGCPFSSRTHRYITGFVT